MTEPLVSIIIPVYNAGKYLKDTILSALAQTWRNKEIIIVDDGSSDDSLAIAKAFECNNIFVISQTNKGASAARNTGLQHARGKYLQFLDADDLLGSDKIEQQINALLNGNDKVAVCSTIHFFKDEKPTNNMPSSYEESFLIDSDDPAWFLTNLWGGYGDNGSMIQPNAWLTPRALIDKAGWWNEELTVDDDGEFFCRVVLQSTGIVKTRGLNFYRRYLNNNENLSAGKLESHYKSLINSLALRYQHINEHAETEALKKAYARSLASVESSMYPSFPSLRKVLKKTLKDLGITSADEFSFNQKIKKRTSKVLGPRLIGFLKSKRPNNHKR